MRIVLLQKKTVKELMHGTYWFSIYSLHCLKRIEAWWVPTMCTAKLPMETNF